MTVQSASHNSVPCYRELDETIKRDIKEKKHTVGNRVKLKLDDASGICSKYCKGGEVVKEGIIDYLERAIAYITIKSPVNIEVSAERNAREKVRKLKELVMGNVYTRLIAANRDLRRNTLIAIGLAFFGLLLLALQVFITNSFDSPVGNEFLLVICWVFLWRAVEIYFFDGQKKVDYLKLMQLYLAEYGEG